MKASDVPEKIQFNSSPKQISHLTIKTFELITISIISLLAFNFLSNSFLNLSLASAGPYIKCHRSDGSDCAEFIVSHAPIFIYVVAPGKREIMFVTFLSGFHFNLNLKKDCWKEKLDHLTY